MFKELLSAVKEFIIRFISSRLFALGLIFTLLFAVLAGRLFELQIVNGDQYLSDYQNRTLTKVTTDSIKSGAMRIMSFSSRRAPKMTGSALSRTSAGAMSPT